MRARGLAPVALLAGCAALAPSRQVEVRVAGHSLYCNTPGSGAAVTLLADASAVREWQSARGVTLVEPGPGDAGAYAIVEMGLYPTGGYDLAVSPEAVARGDTVEMRVRFTGPPPGSLRTQALSSPCALVQLPPGPYSAIEVRDPGGALLARAATGGQRP